MLTRRPLARAGIGLAVGFVGTFAMIQMFEWLGNERGSGEQLEVVLGEPDLEAYCRREHDLTPLLLAPDPNGWGCAGRISNLWHTSAITIDEVCQWQYALDARARLTDDAGPDGWRCVSEP